MIETLIGSFWPYLAALGGAVIGIWRIYAAGKSAGINHERAKNAIQREADLERIKRAADAKPVGGVQDDPFNRDRK